LGRLFFLPLLLFFSPQWGIPQFLPLGDVWLPALDDFCDRSNTKLIPMKLKFFSLLFFIAGCSIAGFSQRTISKSNVMFAPLFKFINTVQEVKISPRLTIETTVRTRPPSKFKFFGLGAIKIDGQDYQPFGETKLSAIGNITEFRVYGKEKLAFHGFYYGPYFSYMHYKLQSASVHGEFHDATGEVYTGDISHVVKLNETGGGFEIGTQGMYLKNKLCIDWTIIGVGIGVLGFQGGIEADNTSQNFDFRNYPEDVDKVQMGIEKVFPHTFKRTIDATSITIGGKIPVPTMRMSVCFGFGY
jgi:hypothetical protein